MVKMSWTKSISSTIFFAFKNYSVEKERRTITVIVKKAEGEKPLTETVERYLNNDYADDPAIISKDLAIFRSGKNKGMGMLITDFSEAGKSQEYLAWLPALRKIRRFAQPAQDDAWGGTAFTFGDVTLRKPSDETHELLGVESFDMTIKTLDIPADQQTSTTKDLPSASDAYKGKEVYKVKSTTKFDSWWYDYRISYVDTKTFADYYCEYFKDGKPVKVLYKDWPSDFPAEAGIEKPNDPRALRWGFWYAKELNSGYESLAYMPIEITRYNTDLPSSLWTKRTLTSIKQ
jgi:hypothetical protein